MKVKTAARQVLEKVIGKFGYTMVRNHELGDYRVVIDEHQVPFDPDAFAKRDKTRYTIGWVIPPPGKGSGGHMTMFRTIGILSDLGFRHKIYVCGEGISNTAEEWKQAVKEFYGVDLGENEIYPTTADMTYTDAVVATSWYTAYVVRNFSNCVSKFYFVQDFEPYFYPMGSEYYFAENTYRFGFRGITAGNWLAEKLRDEYGMETQPFFFSYDRQIHQAGEKKDTVNRVFCYARPSTERRAFEMAVLALEKLSEKVENLEVVFAGQKLDGYDFRFRYRDMGILKIEELSRVYTQCDMCLVLSMTNLSLLPMEVMASGSVVVSNQGPNNAWLVNDENAVIMEPDPISMAETMAYYLEHKEKLAEKRAAGLEYVKQFTWEQEIQKVYDFMKQSIEKDSIETEKKLQEERS